MSDDRPRVDRRPTVEPPTRALTNTAAPDLTDRPDLEAQSPAMRRVLHVAARVAPLEFTVLITGESGVGKERVARWIHAHSHRADRPFVAVNGGALPETLLDSFLFGHVRGAFTDARQDRLGVFEAAQGGTLFLDEIGDVSPATQVRLLRVIQEREIQRVGDTRVRRIDVRLVTATHRDLRQEVIQHRFREDLYYRLRVIELHVPPLRDRPEDLLILAADLLAQAAANLGRPLFGYTPRAIDHLLAYPWPGNIRELEHAIQHACVVSTGVHIDVEDLPEPVRHRHALSAPTPHVRSLIDYERDYILSVLQLNGGNRSRTAAQLHISRATLTRKLQSYRRATETDSFDSK
jgi:two-component system response regulator HydG